MKVIRNTKYKILNSTRKAFRWLTATRRRKALSLLLILLIILTTLRLFFLKPKVVKAATVELTTTATTIQIDVANRYRAILHKDDTTDYLVFYDRAEDNSNPDATYEFVGPYINESDTEYQLSYDAARVSTVIETN